MPADRPPEFPEAPAGSPADGPARLRGRLRRQRVDVGSKSERLALLLAPDDGEPVPLRRAGGNPFRDPELEALEGQVLIVEGERRASYFLVRRFTVCDDDAGSSD